MFIKEKTVPEKRVRSCRRVDAMMKVYRTLGAVLLLMVSVALMLPVEHQDLDSMFEEYKRKHVKVYSGPEEEAMRRGLWEEALKEVEKHNKEADQGLHTFWIGINQFSDRTKEENSRGCALPPLPPEELEQEMKQHVVNFTAEAEVEQAAVNLTDAAVPVEAGGN